MKKAYAVIGANFGDEGKGLMTDYYCKNNPNSLDIRFNGGAQAGHTVVTADGKRHVFSHIGAGTFSGTDTYLSEFFTVNPMLFTGEYKKLAEKYPLPNNIYISENAPLTLPCDMLINRLIETVRGNDRHGSCGLGIYESFLRNSNERYAVKFSDISDIQEKIKAVNTEYVPKRIESLGITDIPEEFAELLENDIITENYIYDLLNMKKICRTTDDSILEKYDTAVFEGAQGLLLDRDRTEYFPNLTPSNTGIKNVREILDKFPDVETEICYMTRSYFTRHGAGKFQTEYNKLSEEYGLCDKTNHTNEYQQNFRYGYFDTAEFIKSIELDSRYLKPDYKTALCVTHLDETDGKILCKDKNIIPEELQSVSVIKKLYTSYSEISDNIKLR